LDAQIQLAKRDIHVRTIISPPYCQMSMCHLQGGAQRSHICALAFSHVRLGFFEHQTACTDVFNQAASSQVSRSSAHMCACWPKQADFVCFDTTYRCCMWLLLYLGTDGRCHAVQAPSAACCSTQLTHACCFVLPCTPSAVLCLRWQPQRHEPSSLCQGGRQTLCHWALRRGM
jgi:hypothetical protein